MNHPTPRLGRLTFALTAILLVAAAVGVGWGIGRFRKSREAAASPVPRGTGSKRGELLYQSSCAACHGPDGRGDGASSASLKPPPRDFAARPWRFEPTKDSIRRVILAGIPGTAMPASQATLADADVAALVEHVYRLATSRPPIAYEPSAEEKQFRAAGFVDLRGTDPPPLVVSDDSGRAIKLADLRGRLVLVHFWGVTCVHCLKEMPSLRDLEARYAPRGLTVLHVCADADDAKSAQALLDKHARSARALIDDTGLGPARFQAQALPAVWLIGPDGKAIGRRNGATDWRSPALIELIDRWRPPTEK